MVEKVTDPSKIVTDKLVLKQLAEQGIDPEYVEFYQDYAMPAIVDGKKEKGKSPYAKFYRDLKSNKRFIVTSGLPMVDADGNKNVAGWDDNGSLKNPRYTEKNNLFKASVDGTKVVLQVKNDQPDGRKQGDKLTYQAKLYLDNLEVLPANADAIRLPVDPVNSNYTDNVLEWDYGICKRRLRIIEGRLLGSWVFASKPAGIVNIKYNQTGDYRLRLGQFKINDDEEAVSPDDFDELSRLEGYPVSISDSATYYPDADAESTSVDGWVYRNANESWANIIANAGTGADPTANNVHAMYFDGSTTPNYAYNGRGIILFDTSGLPDTATVSAATLTFFGRIKLDDGSNTPRLNVYASTPNTNTTLIASDYGQTGTTPYSDTAITYANWNVDSVNPSTPNDFAFNATGIAAISLVGVSKFATRDVDYDVGAGTPTWNAGASYMKFWTAEKGTTYRPKLVVTYSASTDYPISTSPGLTASVSISKHVDWDRATTAGLTAAVVVVKFVEWYKAISPGLTAAVTIVKRRGWTIATATALAISTTISRHLTYGRATIANLTAAVSIIRNWTKTIVTSTALAISTTISKAFGRNITISPDLTVAVSLIRALGKKITTSPGLTASATISKTVAWDKAVSTGLTVSTTISRAVAWGKTVTANLTISTIIAWVGSWILSIFSTLSNDLTIESTTSTDLIIKSTLSNDLTITSTLGGN